ncbi:hypothetical protein ACFQ5J_08490 [Lacticaseibacillus baoqingensis]|uniref:Uncharacterized protein n=1 Tax=Lacticaseibacillus baoqingensis TaxID=2486013 RepID=A0ABW4E9W9_9LACO|nr:hypothetical protein [Lacticaseibacillus baoqingensis]
MSDQTERMLPDIVSKALALPVVRVDRRIFLTKLFQRATEVELMSILRDGPQTVYSLEQLTKTARRVVMHDTEKTSTISFAAGLPSNIAVAVGTGTANTMDFPYVWPKRLLIFTVKKISSLKRGYCPKTASVMS